MSAVWPEPRKLRAGLACVLLAGASVLAAPLAWAQGATGTPVIQGEGMDANRAMSAALARLGRNPRDVEALLQAGESALALGDTQAAIGFLSRADRLQPYQPRVMASLGSARMRMQDPVTAIGLFEDAAKAGTLTGEQIADRGLAYDLVSDNVTAQRYYREALAAGAGDEAARRLALSLAIMGDRRAVETVLAPLLQKQDRGAWRIRAFAFAIMGREEEAVAIANSTMPPEMAAAMAPYLRYMRKLTPAQQAAAANLGFFPQPSQIGQENARIADYIASQHLKRPSFAGQGAVDQGLVPAGEPLGTRLAQAEAASRAGARPAGRRANEELPPRGEQAPPDPKPSRVDTPAAPVELAAATPAPRAAARVVETRPVAPLASTPAAVSSFDLSRSAARAPQVATVDGDLDPAPRPAVAVMERAPQPVAQPVVQPAVSVPVRPAPVPAPVKRAVVRNAAKTAAKKPSFAELFEDFGKVSTATTPASGAVDIRKIQPAHSAPAPAPTPAATPTPAPAVLSAKEKAAEKAKEKKLAGKAEKVEKAREAGKVKEAAPPQHPSRIWVQIAAGRDNERILYDWRKLQRAEGELFKGQKPSISEWGRTNRVLVGPFETEAAAKAFNEKAHKAGHEGSFVWISPAGQVVDSL
ncbi:SPOR domain-containing protein [Novosphingobium humi]|uniref:SPOR domain-containing protein n=1 Tax=Novosphingobium humi TaxID=2282397 RepID=UPI0025AF4616|nr:SPOR domain-containing protein [Novosphingobium humi]WJS98428.1 SPOR domain-containing protein [Novosphingobium humi]